MTDQKNEKKNKLFSVGFDSNISAQTIIGFLVFFWALVAGWVDLKRDVGLVEDQQVRDTRFRNEVRSNYVNREQLEYIVIERIDRLEAALEEQQKRLEAQLTRIENKVD